MTATPFGELLEGSKTKGERNDQAAQAKEACKKGNEAFRFPTGGISIQVD
jgi:hypothetical protein